MLSAQSKLKSISLVLTVWKRRVYLELFSVLTMGSRRQYTEKLRSWNLLKNIPGKAMRSACHKSFRNPGREAFVYKGNPITKEAMGKYQHRHRSLEPDLSSAACEPPVELELCLSADFLFKRHLHSFFGILPHQPLLLLLQLLMLNRSNMTYQHSARSKR